MHFPFSINSKLKDTRVFFIPPTLFSLLEGPCLPFTYFLRAHLRYSCTLQNQYSSHIFSPYPFPLYFFFHPHFKNPYFLLCSSSHNLLASSSALIHIPQFPRPHSALPTSFLPTFIISHGSLLARPLIQTGGLSLLAFMRGAPFIIPQNPRNTRLSINNS